MPDNTSAERQRYRLATGKGLEPAPNPKPNPGYKHGGKVNATRNARPMRRASGRGR